MTDDVWSFTEMTNNVTGRISWLCPEEKSTFETVFYLDMEHKNKKHWESNISRKKKRVVYIFQVCQPFIM